MDGAMADQSTAHRSSRHFCISDDKSVNRRLATASRFCDVLNLRYVHLKILRCLHPSMMKNLQCCILVLLQSIVFGLAAPELPSLILPQSPAINITSQSLLLLQNTTCQAGQCVKGTNGHSRVIRPKDSYYYHVPGSNINVNFSRFGDPVPYANAQICLSQATRDARFSTGTMISRHCMAPILSLCCFIGILVLGLIPLLVANCAICLFTLSISSSYRSRDKEADVCLFSELQLITRLSFPQCLEYHDLGGMGLCFGGFTAFY